MANEWAGRTGRVSRGDLSPVVNTLLDSIPDTDILGDIDTDTKESKTIVGLLKNITELVEAGTDLTDVNNLLSSIKDGVDAIPTTDNSNTITAINTSVEAITAAVDAIPTTDNTEAIAAIRTALETLQTAVNSIPKTDNTSTISTINTTVSNINTAIAAGVIKEHHLVVTLSSGEATAGNLPAEVRKGLYSMVVNSCPDADINGHMGYLQHVDVTSSDTVIRILKTITTGSAILMYRAQDDMFTTNFGDGSYDFTFYYIA